MLVAALL